MKLSDKLFYLSNEADLSYTDAYSMNSVYRAICYDWTGSAICNYRNRSKAIITDERGNSSVGDYYNIYSVWPVQEDGEITALSYDYPNVWNMPGVYEYKYFTLTYESGIRMHQTLSTPDASQRDFLKYMPPGATARSDSDATVTVGMKVKKGGKIYAPDLGGGLGRNTYKQKLCAVFDDGKKYINPRDLDDSGFIPAVVEPRGKPFVPYYVHDPVLTLQRTLKGCEIGDKNNPFSSLNSIFNVPGGTTVTLDSFFEQLTEAERVGVNTFVRASPSYQNFVKVGDDYKWYAKAINFQVTGGPSCTIDFYSNDPNFIGFYFTTTQSETHPGEKKITYSDYRAGEKGLGYFDLPYTILMRTSNNYKFYDNLIYDTLEISPLGSSYKPNPGDEPSSGGGAQSWGQGNASVDTSGGTYDNESDSVSKGTNTALTVGQTFNNYYVLNYLQLLELKQKIWDIQVPGFTKPSEGILSAQLLPYSLTQVSEDSGSGIITIGNTNMTLSTNVRVLSANANKRVYIGTYTLERYFNGFQDFAPHTRMRIYLPFIGYQSIDPTFIQGKRLDVEYVVSYTTGQCIAQLYSDHYLFAKFSGQVGQPIPLTQVNNQQGEALLNLGTSIACGLATGGAALPMVAMSGMLSAVSANKPVVGGSVGGTGENELALPLSCFLEIERPICCVSETYNHEIGRPSMVNKQLGKCLGFTKMKEPRVQTSGTAAENEEINAILQKGVVINGTE